MRRGMINETITQNVERNRCGYLHNGLVFAPIYDCVVFLYGILSFHRSGKFRGK